MIPMSLAAFRAAGQTGIAPPVGLTYPYSSNPEMWIANWPLTITCASCHVPFDNATPEGCGLCHSFPAKAELHLLHSAKKSPGMGISCQICH